MTGSIVQNLINAAPIPYSRDVVNRAIEHLINMGLIVSKREAKHLTELRVRHQLPTQEQILAMSTVVRVRLVYLILQFEYDPTLQQELPLADLHDRIKARFPYLDAAYTVDAMTSRRIIPKRLPT